MDTALWLVAGILAAANLAAGAFKLLSPYDKIVANTNLTWAEDFSPNQVRGIGLAELLGAAGLILPWATGIAEVLTPVAAVGIAAVQAGAFATHARRGETKNLPVNAVLIALAVFVAVGRFADLG